MSTQKVTPLDISPGTQLESTLSPYRASPLSTRQIIIAIVSLSIFSFFYLVYAQHHALLFYAMTGFIAIYIVFVYTSGIGAVLYMVLNDYEIGENEMKSSRNIEEESTI
ncbi:unnamed protein product [Caenorhabditis angaria]|uniref:Transmembrane protein n=1 Tax=Caenorhabditis angaria TaxID=860376 RepID=A0A9P1IPP8_9PELO|nr:unnamed protein product [Caenorhabditis angaria]